MSSLRSIRPLRRAALLAGLAALATVAVTAAHPLGNFTVNRYSRIEVDAGALRVRHILDVAEIPSVQERQIIDADRDGTVTDAEWETYKTRKVDELRRGLELTVDGRRVELQTERTSVSVSPGQANLPLIRVEAWFRADWSGGGEHRATFRDRNEPSRLGWRELVVRSGSGVSLARSTAPAEDLSDELRSYPQDLLQSPLDRREAEWVFTAAAAAPDGPAAPALNRDTLARPAEAFTSLITVPDLNLGVVVLALLASAVLGGIHAVSPGHGKTVMAAYIVGTRGTFLHALALASSVTVSHTAGVLVLGAITLFASNLFLPEQLYPWLTLASGSIVLVIGVGLLVRAADGWQADQPHAHERGHGHGHPHPHSHQHGHRHDLPITWRNLFALGLAGGIVPSASALVVLLSAVALGRLGFGLLLIVAFGVGMAVVLTATGFLVVQAGQLLARFTSGASSPARRNFTRAVPLVSALVMTLAGGVVTIQAIAQLGLVRA